MGGRGSSFGTQPLASYESFPISLRIGGGAGASADDKRERTKIVNSFLADAKPGNIYSTGNGIGSSGAQFEVVSFNRSPNKMGLRWTGSNRQPVALSRANVASFISNGAKLIKRGN